MKKIKCSYLDILNINASLVNLPNAGSIKLKHKVLSISRVIKPIIEDLNKLVEATDELKAYQEKTREVYKTYCETDNGELVFYKDDSYTEKESKPGARAVVKFLNADSKSRIDAIISVLDEENAELLAARKQVELDYQKHLEDETEIEFNPISIDELETVQTPDADGIIVNLPYSIINGLHLVLQD